MRRGIPLTITHLVFDCADPARLAEFWAEALGFARGPTDEDHAWVWDPARRMPHLLFNRVPEPKVVKNRLHLDLGTDEVEAEVVRLEALGAQRLRHVAEHGQAWWIMADPEGNEFCVP